MRERDKRADRGACRSTLVCLSALLVASCGPGAQPPERPKPTAVSGQAPPAALPLLFRRTYTSLAAVDPPGRRARVLFKGQVSDAGMAVDADNVYWFRATPSGGATVYALETKPLDAPGQAPRILLRGLRDVSGLVLAGSSLYWLEPRHIGALALATDGRAHGMHVMQLPKALYGSTGLATDGVYLYIANCAHGVARLPVSGGPAQWLSRTFCPAAVTVSAGYVYWSGGHGFVGRARLDGSAPKERWSTLPNEYDGFDLTSDGGYLFSASVPSGYILRTSISTRKTVRYRPGYPPFAVQKSG